MTTDQPRPNLFLVGNFKCGTRAMRELLNQHPDIFMCPGQDPNFFCNDLHEEADRVGHSNYFPIRSETDYLTLFKSATDKTVIGEASVWYFLSESAPQEISQFAPNAKIIVIHRATDDLLRSLHAARVHAGSEHITSLREALDAEPKRKATGFVPLAGIPQLVHYSLYADFERHIDRYRTYFCPEQIMVIEYEEYDADNLGVLRRVFNWLDVDPTFEPSPTRINLGTQVRFRQLINIVQRPFIIRWLRRALPPQAYGHLQHLFRIVAFRRTGRSRPHQ